MQPITAGAAAHTNKVWNSTWFHQSSFASPVDRRSCLSLLEWAPTFMALLLTQLYPSYYDEWRWWTNAEADANLHCRVNRHLPGILSAPTLCRSNSRVTTDAFCSSASVAGRWVCGNQLLPGLHCCMGIQWSSCCDDPGDSGDVTQEGLVGSC